MIAPKLDQVGTMLVDAVQDEARHTADLLCEALNGRSQKRIVSNPVAPPQPVSLAHALAAAAALRREEWRGERLDQYLSPGATRVTFSLPDLLRRIHNEPTSRNARKLRQFAVETMLTWIRHFAWAARRHLACDIVLGSATNTDQTDLLAALADYLLTNGSSAGSGEGDDNARS